MTAPLRLNRRRLLTTLLAGGLVPALPSPTVLAASPAPAKTEPMRIRAHFAGHTLTIALNDTPSARDLLTLLPLSLTISDYSTNEKIAYLPRKLTEEGNGPFDGEAPGDFAYYAPWGNLVFYYAGYRYSRGLIRLGRLESDIAPLLTRGEFPLRIEA